MRQPHLSRGCAVAIAAWLALGRTVSQAQTWDVRYGQQGDQKPEWTEKGFVPGWRLTWTDRTAPDVSWQDDEQGNYRGWLLLCKPCKMPDRLPAELTVSFEYQTYCACNRADFLRSGMLYAVAMTQDAWQSLSAEPALAEVLDIRRHKGIVSSVLVHPQGEDVAQWRATDGIQLGNVPASLRGQTAMVGVAWGAYHYGCDEHGAMRNFTVDIADSEHIASRFWDALDLEQAELAGVKEAVAAGDLRRATQELAQYYRKRTEPVVANPVEPAQPSAYADRVLAHTYRLAGCPSYTFEGEIVWNADPFNYNQWPVALNRHFEWVPLAAAYLKTGDSTYAREWETQLHSWVDAGPILIAPRWIEGPYNQSGRGPLSLDAGIRMGQTWFRAFDVFRACPDIADETLVKFVRSCCRHALYLMQEQNFKRGSNWGAMEANGLYHIGVLLPEFRDAQRWRETALARTSQEIDDQVYPDGAQTELAPGYHGVSLRNFLGVMRLANANGLELPADYVSRLERMFEYYLRITMPDWRMPALNDSGRGGIQGWFRDASELFPKRADFQWAHTAGRKGSPPAFESVAMPYAGWVMMRSGWTDDAKYLLFDAGPFGTGHQHEDKLSVIIFAHGHELVTEAGVYAYDTSQWRRYVLSTRGHSTVRVDGSDQACRRDRGEYRADQPDMHGFHSTDCFDYARDTHTAGYGSQPDKSVRHRRRVLFVKPDYWVLVDDLWASDEGEHTAESQFLVNADSAILDQKSRWVTSAPAGAQQARIAIVPLSPAEMHARIVCGQTEPEVLGFIPEGFEKLRPAPAALFSVTFRTHACMAYAFVPFTGDTCPVAASQSVGTDDTFRATLRLTDGREDSFEITGTSLSAKIKGRARFESVE